jgi:hypothetical protein
MASGASRDLGLQRIATSTRFLAVGALVAGGVLSAAVAKALPGKSNHPAAPLTTNTVSPAQTTPAPSISSGGDSGAAAPPLTAPAQAPQPTTAPPVVSSGGS